MSFPPSQLDSSQILPAVYDDAGRLRVDAEVTANISGAQEVIISDADDSIKIGDGTGTYADVTASNALKTDSSATTQPISAVSLPLPSGAATEAKQDVGNNSLAAIDANTDNLDVALSTRLKAADTLNAVTTVGTITNVVHVDDNSGSLTVDNSGTFAVQAAQSGTWNINNISGTVSLPTGASTAANQATEIASLQLIDDVVHTQNSSLSKAVPLMGQFDDASTTTITEDNVGVSRITSQRALHTNLRNQSGTEIGTSTNPLIAITQNINGASDLSKLVVSNKLYSMGTDISAATSNVNNPLVLFRNPSGSGKTIYIYKISFATDVANVNINAKIWSDPTVTSNGSAITVGSRYIGGGASAAVSLLTSLPTVSSSGTQLEAGVNGQNANSLSMIGEFSIAIAENHALLFTADPLSNNRNVAVSIIWAEV